MSSVHCHTHCSAWVFRGIVPSLLPRAKSLGVDARTGRRGTQQVQERAELRERRHGQLGRLDQFERFAALPGGHPLRQEYPGPVREQADEVVVARAGSLTALGGQPLTEERVPTVVNDDGARKLRSMSLFRRAWGKP